MSRQVVARGLRYAKNGPPARVLVKEEYTTPFDPNGSDVIVKMVAAPVNPSDRRAIHNGSAQGPTVGGSEGVGIVQEVGAGCTTRQKGDHVVFNTPGVGTWADHVVVNEAKLDQVPSDLQPEDASLMGVYGAAWRMVNDYGRIKPDDVCWVLGEGPVATATACLLQQKGARIVMVLPTGHPEDAQLHENLRAHLPNAMTLRTTHLTQGVITKLVSDLPSPKFIFNGMGGPALKEVVSLASSCTVVSFANTSSAPLKVSVGTHLYKNVDLLPFCYNSYLASSTQAERESMYQKIGALLRSGAHGNSKHSEHQWRPKLYARAERYAFEPHHKDAVQNAGLLFQSRRPILRFGEEYEWTHSGEWHKDYEYFLPKEMQYIKNIDTALSERHAGEYKSLEFGGKPFQEQFVSLWDTEDAEETRKGMGQLVMRTDQYKVVEDTYTRYLEVQSWKYNINFSPLQDKHSVLNLPNSKELDNGGFLPDDDPYIAKALAENKARGLARSSRA